MSTFTIDQDNNITAYAHTGELAQNGASAETSFDSQEALAQISAEWPLNRWVEIWNSIPGQTPVKKFQDRKRAIARVWAAIQSLGGHQPKDDAVARPVGRKPKASKATQKAAKNGPGKAAKASEGGNKKAEVIALIKRSKGATLTEIMDFTGWQAHTVRGFMSILGSKSGLSIDSTRNAAGERTYKIPK